MVRKYNIYDELIIGLRVVKSCLSSFLVNHSFDSDRSGLHSVLLLLERNVSVDHLIHSNVKFNGVEFKKTIKVIYSTSYPLSMGFIYFFEHVDGSAD